MRCRAWCALAAAAVTAVGLALFARPGPPDLMRRARRLALPADARYHWLSGREVALMEPAGPGRYRVMRADAFTGRQRPLTTFAAPGAPLDYSRDYGAVSPDGRWMLWLGERQCAEVALDGSGRVYRYAGAGDGDLTVAAKWLPDGSGWALRCLTQQPGVLGLLVTRHREQAAQRRFVYNVGYGSEYFAGVTNRNEALLFGNRDHNAGLGHGIPYIKRSPLEDAGLAGRETRLNALRGEYLYEAVASPQGRRAAFLVSSMRTSWFRNILASLRLPVQDRSTEHISLRSVDADGSHLRTLGDTSVASDWVSGPEDIRWTPDGKALSFQYRSALWWVPAQ